MRDKLALTIALTAFAVALGAGLAGAAPLVDPGSVTVPTLPNPPQVTLPNCAGIDINGDGVADLPDPSCPPPGTTPPSTTPPSTTPPTSTTTTGTTTTPTTGSTNGSKGTGSKNQALHNANGNGGANGKTGGVGPNAKNDQKKQLKPPPQYNANGTPTVSNPTTTIAPFGPAPIGVPNFVIDQFEIPPFLLPIYQACGSEYDIPWQVLASINKIETAFGTNLNVSSAGAIGWMQFLPSTWQAYGVDANGDGRKDPYNPVDAICAAGRYLKAAGGSQDLSRAILAYNHAQWYVDEVLLYARGYGKLPDGLLGSLTGLTQGAHFPIAANARYADDIQVRQTLARAKPSKRGEIGHNAARIISSSPTRTGINIYTHSGAPVVAVNDGVITKVGKSKKLGNFIVLRDDFGNRFTYTELGSIAATHSVPKQAKLTASDFKLVTPPSNGKDSKPSVPATAGTQPGAADNSSSAASAARTRQSVGHPGPVNTENLRPRLYALPQRPDNTSNASLGSQIDSLAAQKVPAYDSFKHYFNDVFGLNKQNSVQRPLRVGSKILGGTVIAKVGPSTGGVAPHINFAITPTGNKRAIDPKPILDGWKLLEATAIYRAAGKSPFSSNPSVSQILLMPKVALERRVLADPRLEIVQCGRNDIATGQVDRRVLAAMEFLVAKGFRPTITSLQCGQSKTNRKASRSATSGRDGASMDISQINGIPVVGHQGPGTLSDALIKAVLQLQGASKPSVVASSENLPGPVSYADSSNSDVIHIGFSSLAGYVDPFAEASNLGPARVDMGVDYTGTGPILAIGDARVLRTGAPGWPQGGGVLYQLLDGSRAGMVVFVYEGVKPVVQAGDHVNAGEPVALFTPGSIEIGFADKNGVPLSHAIYHEGMVTPWGTRMALFLSSLGTPTVLGKTATLSAEFQQLLAPGQWQRLVTRLGQIPNPTVPTSPSAASTRAGHSQRSSHGG
jgi:murein DD-endopeptidase MepM/ murein hydrolase activator NlpD